MPPKTSTFSAVAAPEPVLGLAPARVAGSFRATVVSSLRNIDDETLERVTSSSNVFFDRRWLRMVEALDLTALARGELELRFVVASRDGEPVGVCPFFVTRSPSIYLFYSLEKFFFSPWWLAGVEKQAPHMAGAARWAQRAVGLCATLARATRAGINGWILAASPLSHRGGIAVAALPEPERDAVREVVLACLKEVATEEALPLCFLGVSEEDRELRGSLSRSGFEEVFVAYDNLLELTSTTFEGYLEGFRADARRLFKREIRGAHAAGVRFETTSQLGVLGPTFDRLYRETARRYGAEHFHQPPEFWAALEHHMGPHAEAVVAHDESGVTGFSLLLHKGDDLWFHRVGRAYDGVAAEAAIYFNLAFYEPVQRALARGAKRIWFGFGSWEAKRRRGAVGHPISSAFWFPSRWSRALLTPYLRTFGRISRNAMVEVSRPSSYVKPR